MVCTIVNCNCIVYIALVLLVRLGTVSNSCIINIDTIQDTSTKKKKKLNTDTFPSIKSCLFLSIIWKSTAKCNKFLLPHILNLKSVAHNKCITITSRFWAWNLLILYIKIYVQKLHRQRHNLVRLLFLQKNVNVNFPVPAKLSKSAIWINRTKITFV